MVLSGGAVNAAASRLRAALAAVLVNAEAPELARAQITSTPEVPAETARALVGAIRVASCPACRAPLTGRKTVCSGKCRATLSRRREEQRRQDRDARIAALLREVLELVEEDRLDGTAVGRIR